MKSGLEDSAKIEPQGYFRYGFGSFLPKPIPFRHKRFPHDHRGRPTWPATPIPGSTQTLGESLIQKPRTMGFLQPKNAPFPDIHISKLVKRDEKEVLSMEVVNNGDTSKIQEDPDIDHASYYNTSVWGRRAGLGSVARRSEIMPSLAAGGIFPQLQGGKAVQDSLLLSSWWERSRKDFHLKETKLPLKKPVDAVCGPTGVSAPLQGNQGGDRVLFDGLNMNEGLEDDNKLTSTGISLILT